MNVWLKVILLTFTLGHFSQLLSSEERAKSAQHPQCQNFFSTVCETSWPSLDPTGEVDYAIRGEVMALRMMGDIVRQRPELSSREVENNLTEKIYGPKKRIELQAIFKFVKSVMREKVLEMAGHENDQGLGEFLSARLEEVVLELPPPEVPYTDAADILTKNSLYYERTPGGLMHIRIGGAYLLSNTSWFNRSYSLAHELAHAIDPCELKLMRIESSSYNRHQKCFLDQGWLKAERMNCSSHGHLSEVFADWMATHVQMEILKRKTKNFSLKEKASSVRNSVKDLCEQEASIGRLIFNRHPTPAVRIQQIFGTHPDLSDFQSCRPVEGKMTYCPLNPVKANP